MNCYRSRRLRTDLDTGELERMRRLVIRQAATIRSQGLRLHRLATEIQMLESLVAQRLIQVFVNI